MPRMVRGPPSAYGCLLATALLLLLGLGPALGSSLDLGEEARATEGGDCTSAAAGVAPDGTVHIVYTTYDGEVSVWHLLASPEGETLAGPTLVSPEGTVDLTGIDVDVDGGGVAHAVMSVSTGEGLYTDVHYARLSAEGDLEVGPRRVFTSPHHSYDPRVAVDDAGVARVAFNDMGVREVRWLRVGTSGSRVGECVVVSDAEGRTAQTDMPRVAIGRDGVSHVAWMECTNPRLGYGVELARVSATGEVLGRTEGLVQHPSLYPYGLELDADGEGRVHVVYMQPNALSFQHLYHIAVSAQGDALGEPVQVSSGRALQCYRCDVAALGDGWLHVAYTQTETLVDGAEVLRLRERPGEDQGWEEAEVLAEADGYPHIHLRDAGTGAISYIRGGDLFVIPVSDGHQDNLPPTPVLEVAPASAGVGEAVTLDGSASTDPDGQVTDWRFIFGDGGDTGWTDRPTASHAYGAAGAYTATLLVRDDDGAPCLEAATCTVTVTAEANRPPVADLVLRPASVVSGDQVTLDGSGSHDVDGQVVRWRFDFGDGGDTGWLRQPTASHVYEAPGRYTASVEVEDDDGAPSEAPATATVAVGEPPNEPPTAVIGSVGPSPALEGHGVSFEGSGKDADGQVVAHRWLSDRDGELSTEAAFTTSDLTSGTHSVTYRVQDDDGDWSAPANRVLVVRPNTPARLGDRTATTSVAPGDSVEFKVAYTDVDGELPEAARLHLTLGGVSREHTLREVEPRDDDPTDGKLYSVAVTLEEEGVWSYRFEFEQPVGGSVATDAATIEVEAAGGPEDPYLMAAAALVVIVCAGLGLAAWRSRSARGTTAR